MRFVILIACCASSIHASPDPVIMERQDVDMQIRQDTLHGRKLFMTRREEKKMMVWKEETQDQGKTLLMRRTRKSKTKDLEHNSPDKVMKSSLFHYAADGAPGNTGGGDQATTCAFNTNSAAAIRCCNSIQNGVEQGVAHSCESVCTGNPRTQAAAQGQYTTYADAVSKCNDRGLRLCTQSELETNICQGTGCWFDEVLVWTSDSCTTCATYTCPPGHTQNVNQVCTGACTESLCCEAPSFS